MAGPYTTPDEVRAKLSFISADPNSAAGLTNAQLEEAIGDAKDEIDAKLAVRYPTPFDDPRYETPIPVPPLVHQITTNIAAYLATLTFLRGAPLEPTSPVFLRYTRAEAMLTGVANGTIPLDLPAGVQTEEPGETIDGGATVVNTYNGTMFSPSDFDIGPAFGRRRVGAGFPDTSY